MMGYRTLLPSLSLCMIAGAISYVATAGEGNGWAVGDGGVLHAGAELLGTLALGLALDGSSEGVGHAKVEGESIILVVCVHLGVRCRDVQTEIIAEEIVRIKSKAKLPLEERVG